MIDRTLKGEVVARDALKDRDKIKKREREFRVPTSITFDNEGLGDLHDHRGRYPRPAGPALRPDPHAGGEQRLHRLAR